MLSQSIKVVGITELPCQDGGIPRSQLPPLLALQGPDDDGGAGWRVARGDEVVDESNQVIGQPDGDLCAHPTMVPLWDALVAVGACFRQRLSMAGPTRDSRTRSCSSLTAQPNSSVTRAV